MKTNSIYNQHEENKEWLNKLFFYKEDIAIMERRLEEVTKANTSKELLAHVERFQNQLIIQKNNIDELKHLVTQNESKLEAEVIRNPVAVDHRTVPSHSEEKESIESFEKNFNALRKELRDFLFKHL